MNSSLPNKVEKCFKCLRCGPFGGINFNQNRKKSHFCRKIATGNKENHLGSFLTHAVGSDQKSKFTCGKVEKYDPPYATTFSSNIANMFSLCIIFKIQDHSRAVVDSL